MTAATGGTAQERATAVRAQEAALRARALEEAANDFAARGIITPDVAARYRRGAGATGAGGQAGKLTVETQDEYDALRRSMPDSAITSRYNVARGIRRQP